MYCRNCGKELPDDSKFCSECGTKIDEEKNDNSAPQQTEEHSQSSGCLWFFIVLIAIICIIVLIVYLANVGSGKKKSSGEVGGVNIIQEVTSRKATINDITYDLNMDLSSLSVTIDIIPKYDIDNLSIKLEHYDESGNLITSQTKVVGNVVKGVQVQVKISIMDFSISQIFKIDYSTIQVTSGTVSYFQ